MKKKMAVLFSSVLAVSMLFAGCKKDTEPAVSNGNTAETQAVVEEDKSNKAEGITADEVLRQSQENLANVSSYSGSMDMKLGMAISMDGSTTDLNMGMNGTYQSVKEPHGFYMNGSLSLSILNLEEPFESYIVEEDGKTISYTKVYNEWSSTEGATSMATDYSDLYGNLSGVAYTMENQTSKYNDKEVYVLKAHIDGDNLGAVVGSAAALAGATDAQIVNGMIADITIQVYTDTMLPASTSVVFTRVEAEAAAPAEGETEAAIEQTILKSISLTMYYDDYNSITQIAVPEEAKNGGSAEAPAEEAPAEEAPAEEAPVEEAPPEEYVEEYVEEEPKG